jgi:hypothetical protein
LTSGGVPIIIATDKMVLNRSSLGASTPKYVIIPPTPNEFVVQPILDAELPNTDLMHMICSTIALYWSLLMLWIWTATEACVKHLKHKNTSAAQHLCSALNHPLNGIDSVSFASIKSKPWLMPVRPCAFQNDMQAQNDMLACHLADRLKPLLKSASKQAEQL